MTQPQPKAEHGRHRGRPSSWFVVTLMILATCAGGGALAAQAMLVFYICVGVFFLVGVPLGFAVRIMDDTVKWTVPESALQQAKLSQAGSQEVAQEGREPTGS